jgi:hypothetical protein
MVRGYRRKQEVNEVVLLRSFRERSVRPFGRIENTGMAKYDGVSSAILRG